MDEKQQKASLPSDRIDSKARRQRVVAVAMTVHFASDRNAAASGPKMSEDGKCVGFVCMSARRVAKANEV